MSRASWKIPYIHHSFFRLLSINFFQLYLTASRSSKISPKLKGVCLGIYTGRIFKFVRIRSDMIFLKFGEFAPTRRMSSVQKMHLIKQKKNIKKK